MLRGKRPAPGPRCPKDASPRPLWAPRPPLQPSRRPAAPRLPSDSQSAPHGAPVRPAPSPVGGGGGVGWTGAVSLGGGRPAVTFIAASTGPAGSRLCSGAVGRWLGCRDGRTGRCWEPLRTRPPPPGSCSLLEKAGWTSTAQMSTQKWCWVEMQLATRVGKNPVRCQGERKMGDACLRAAREGLGTGNVCPHRAIMEGLGGEPACPLGLSLQGAAPHCLFQAGESPPAPAVQQHSASSICLSYPRSAFSATEGRFPTALTITSIRQKSGCLEIEEGGGGCCTTASLQNGVRSTSCVHTACFPPSRSEHGTDAACTPCLPAHRGRILLCFSGAGGQILRL